MELSEKYQNILNDNKLQKRYKKLNKEDIYFIYTYYDEIEKHKAAKQLGISYERLKDSFYKIKKYIIDNSIIELQDNDYIKLIEIL